MSDSDTKMMITERFELKEQICGALRQRKPEFGFGGFGETTYYRTYSRKMEDGSQEHWADTVIRVTNGVMSVRKHHYALSRLHWDEGYWQSYAAEMAEAMFEMKWLPPGRGLWAMGTEYVYTRGAAALNNCGAVDTADLATAADWTMDMLMCGVGVGFNTAWKGRGTAVPDKSRPVPFVIPDSREGWVASVRLLIESYTRGGAWFTFDYDMIRPAGAPIRGFGGTASGPEPLKTLHRRIESYLDAFCAGETDATRCTADIFNAIGACVVAGNVRRSAEIALGSAEDESFLSLKDYERFPERAEIGWMSNNTVVLKKTEDFAKLPIIAKHIIANGEPGIMNLINVQKYGRYGRESEDRAWLANPCSEIPLESYELCNLAEVFPSRCAGEDDFYRVLEYATFYASTVALLPTHRPETNAIVVRNRRIGVSLSGMADMLDQLGATELTRRLRRGYKVVRSANRKLASEAGVPPSIRVTTIKPSGTISQLAGVSSGMHFPTFQYALRRMRVGNDTAVCRLLKAAGVAHEPDVYSENTTVFAFPIDQGKTRKATEVSAWEQFAFLAMIQREWSDNMVSCTVYFDPETEGHQVEHMLAQFAPVIKSVSMLPHSESGAYKQMPYEGISRETYEEKLAAMPHIDWNKFADSDGIESRFCSNDTCEL
ncbi:fused protease/ribonucleoside-triphosphate reductase [Sulfurimonas sp. HSL-3221]|uniref:fused protease/ribonucleoside-triphosphate reductase n=1 Tax=Sulfurimonadaceae TaxID=2771471 RepID=UPI001E33255C|nr:fused protease/ribonucleoside-triphosphate reductase [Sulfurimonas sp. HSL-3221]UFS61829.1 fused protease/ribonucleoside-triphosphate reductase [Sulfurimonas sp. HSL-3221]